MPNLVSIVGSNHGLDCILYTCDLQITLPRLCGLLRNIIFTLIYRSRYSRNYQMSSWEKGVARFGEEGEAHACMRLT